MKPSIHQKTIEEAYRSWEPLLYSKLVQLDHFLLAMKTDLSAAGMSYKDSEEFLNRMMAEMNLKIKTERVRPRRSKGIQRRKVV